MYVKKGQNVCVGERVCNVFVCVRERKREREKERERAYSIEWDVCVRDIERVYIYLCVFACVCEGVGGISR